MSIVRRETVKEAIVKRSHLTILAALVLALVLAVGFQAVSAQDNPPVTPAAGYPNNTITVSGLGTASGTPDIAYIELGVETVDPELAAAYEQAGETMQAVTGALVGVGIAAEDIRTSNVSIFPQDDFDPQTGQPSGRSFHVNNTLRVTVRDITQVEQVISAGIEAGANTIYNFYFGIDDTTALEQQARLDAIENARGRADALAAALGLTVGDPIVIAEGTAGGGQQPRPFGGGGGGFDAMNSLPISPGSLDVNVVVTITYSIGA
jgi:uncharacterized protein